MATFACPRCKAHVTGTPGALVCPNCGFGAKPGAPPAAGAARQPMMSPAPAYAGGQAMLMGTPFRNVGGLATTATALILASAAWDLLSQALVQFVPSDGLAIAVGGIGFLAFGVIITGIVLFCIALFRMMDNVRRAQPAAGISPGWAIGSMFIPFAHLVMPYFPIRKAVAADGGPQGPMAAWFWTWSASMALVYALFVVFIAMAGSLFGDVLKCASANEGDEAGMEACLEGIGAADVFNVALGFQWASTAVSLVAAILLLLFMRQWVAHQKAKYRIS